MLIFYEILVVIGYNLVLMLFLAAGLIFPKHGVGIFTVGVLMQVLSCIGNIMGMIKETVTTDSVLQIVSSVILIVAGYFLIQLRKKHSYY